MARLNSFTFAFAVAVALQVSTIFETVNSQKVPRLEILPVQPVQKKPIGKSHMLTCRPDVPDTNLVTDLQWRDNLNMTVMPKTNYNYHPLYDSNGRKLAAKAGARAPPMYTETLPGDQSLALIVTSLTESMAGMYFCSASYANTELLEIGVKIETYAAITWKDAPENQFPILGADYNVRCEVTASPSPTVDWLRNGDPIKTGGRYVVETHGLFIRNVEETDDGIYTCRAAVILTGELVERNIRVEVQIKPRVDGLPISIEATEGQQFAIGCNATGKPVPEITWTKVLSQQNVADADRFTVNPQTGLLRISNVEQDDYGSYICMATNAAGAAQATMLLNVLVKPRIYEFQNITMPVGNEGQLICRATGRPPPEITFRRWGSQEEFIPGQQISDDRIILEQTGDEERGESVGVLRITKLMRTDDGLYECVARNKGDNAFRVGHITVEYPPSFEHMKGLPPVFSWEQRRANLSCLAEGIPNATIEWRWNDRLIKDLFDANLNVEGTGPRSDLLINPVAQRYYTAYKCIATNRLGTAELLMQLKEAHVPQHVQQATPSVVTATTIKFDLIPPATELGMPITAFSVQYKDERTLDWAMAANRTWSPDSPYIVEGLRPQTTYNFRFAARNHVGIGPWGANKLQSTPRRSAPEEPRTLHTIESPADNNEDPIVASPYADHFELRWNVPNDNGEPIDFYEIRFCPGEKVNGDWNSIDDLCEKRELNAAEATNFEMSELTADTYYRIELRAHNAIGYSTPANLLLKTARGLDVVLRVDQPTLSSTAIVGIAIVGVLLLLLIVDAMCCATRRAGLFATLCRRTKRSPSDLDDDETKLGREEKQPLNSSSTIVIGGEGGLLLAGNQTAAPMPMPMPAPAMKHSTIEYDGRVAHSRSGEIIGKNSAV